ncbi:MAG: hypothetical protein MUO40_07380 [Anaerolineaceae bacterium]|nr:hypothetical protein [Anaerolineaceae bacterium]
MKHNLSKGLAIIFAFSIVGLSLGGGVHANPLPGETRGSVLYVKSSGVGDCSDWDHACDLQAALSSETSVNEIWVAAGTYIPTLTNDRTISFQLKSGVAIYGGFPVDGGVWEERDWVTNPTTLSGDIGDPGNNADNSYHVVSGSEVDGTAVLDGFTISDGNANSSSSPNYFGGGMINDNSSPTLTNVTFSANSAKHGGGMRNSSNSSPTLNNVTFSANSASYSGGGMSNSSNSSPTLTNVTFSGNTASDTAGGMANFYDSNPTLINVTFSGNSATTVAGGMRNYESSPTLTNVTFSENTSESGGGMFNYNSSPSLINVTFSGNSATQVGGGMFTDYHSPTLINVTFSGNTASQGGGMYNYQCSPTLTNVTFSGNTAFHWGGGMDSDYSTLTLTNVTFVGNTADYDGIGGYYGGGMSNFNCSTTLTNAIFWGNTPDQIYGSATVTYSDIQGGRTGTGNINLDPLLGPLADNGGFTLTHALLTGSPTIDAGSPTTCPATDQRSFPRPIDGDGDGTPRCDMGAYEYGSFIPIFSFLPVIFR